MEKQNNGLSNKELRQIKNEYDELVYKLDKTICIIEKYYKNSKTEFLYKYIITLALDFARENYGLFKNLEVDFKDEENTKKLKEFVYNILLYLKSLEKSYGEILLYHDYLASGVDLDELRMQINRYLYGEKKANKLDTLSSVTADLTFYSMKLFVVAVFLSLTLQNKNFVIGDIFIFLSLLATHVIAIRSYPELDYNSYKSATNYMSAIRNVEQGCFINLTDIKKAIDFEKDYIHGYISIEDLKDRTLFYSLK